MQEAKLQEAQTWFDNLLNTTFMVILVAIATTIWRGAKYLLSWKWAKVILHWIVTSAGVVSELAFLAASIWVSLNANVHTFILSLGVAEKTTEMLTGWSATAYVALPECISFLAVITTLSHVRTFMANREDRRPLIWIVFFGLPTLVFVGLTVYTLGHAVTDLNFQMDNNWKVIRVWAAWEFAFCSYVYSKIGEKQEADRLKEKDVIISDLKLGLDSKVSELTEKLESETSRLNAVIAEQKTKLEETKKQKQTLENAVLQSTEDGLEGLSQDIKNWLLSEPKSIKQEEITEKTGHSKTKVNNALAAGKLKNPPNSKTLILKKTIAEWLKDNPPTKGRIFEIKSQNIRQDTEELNAVSM